MFTHLADSSRFWRETDRQLAGHLRLEAVKCINIELCIRDPSAK